MLLHDQESATAISVLLVHIHPMKVGRAQIVDAIWKLSAFFLRRCKLVHLLLVQSRTVFQLFRFKSKN